ncbi:MAG: hypothetical protein H5T36_01170 [Methanobacteriaceae archaeon]|nr:hypothetical protein [Methanobacteriaceae archaeon]
MDDRGMAFTTDMLLSLIIVTIALGMITDQMEILSYKMEDFTSRQSLERLVNDAADYLVKSPGEPQHWERQVPSNTIPGLAVIDRGRPVPNYLFNKKVGMLKKNPQLLKNLVNTDNYYLLITNANNSSTIVEIGSPPPSNAKEVAVANRSCMLVPGEAIFSMVDLMHINPAHPSGQNASLWYSKAGNPPIYVGPGNVTTSSDPNSSFTVTNEDLEIYDYYIRIDANTGVTSVNYGFTDGDAVVNGTYGDFDDRRRQDAIEAELDRIYGQPGWLKIKDLGVGAFIPVDDDIKKVLDSGGGPDMKLWLKVQSNPNADFDITLVRVFHGQGYNKIPVKLILYIWE